MRVVLEIDKGPLAGTRHELVNKCYRAVGREGIFPANTTSFSTTGDAKLDPDDIRRIEEHIRRRNQPDDEESSIRLGTFKRDRDILVDDDKISRTHAMFFLDDHGPSVVDLVSTNGTLVNGERVIDSDLHDGDIVNIGKSRFVVRVEET